MSVCANCGGSIVECVSEHSPGDLCRGWRHVYADDVSLYHSIICPTSTTADDRGWDVATPVGYVRPGIEVRHPVRLVLTLVLLLVVAAAILDSLFGWSS